eukprot:CAMPEP_0118707984 /NCGR_PEP_ID=MMETSP0800-20121206/21570_1 /TAXON_ID=210618 ORGANISM="Striatella unipunctata, Strain CCMP2910" /NCGR_SAMPLE_ID=MMETSP0800 /ASSEMBLY_ACC=CAM_ASM_000638 /LENGTH=150 /DNA_ID=CAMNT_0006610997 /DNA_START=81 /DNA_END=530 /DNA_ORIENTATION=-
MTTPLTITSGVTCKDAIALLKEQGFDMVPVVEDSDVIGVVTEGNMTKYLLSGRAEPDATVVEAGVIYKRFHQFTMNDSLADLAMALDHDPYALIVTEQRCFQGRENNTSSSKKHKLNGDTPGVVTRCVVSGIVTRIDLLDFVTQMGQDTT